MTGNYQYENDRRPIHALDADLVSLASAIEKTNACSIWNARLTNLRVTKIERRLRTAWFCRQTYWHAELESTDGWKATIHSTKVIDAVDPGEFMRDLTGTGVDVCELDERDIRHALHMALGDTLRVAQDRIDTDACDAPCIEERGGAR